MGRARGLGWLALGALCLALGAAVLFLLISLGRRAWTAKDDRDRRLVFVLGGLFLINLFAVQFSGDINDNRAFWTALALGWLVTRHDLPGPTRHARA